MTKFALILNGNTERPQLDNVERSLANVFEKEGYETFVASPERPKTQPDHYAPATLDHMKRLIGILKGRISVEDELVIFTIGRGDSVGDLFISDITPGNDFDLSRLLEALPYKQRIVVADPSYTTRPFLLKENAKSHFVGVKDRLLTGMPDACCRQMSFRLWAPAKEVPDLNGDGRIQWDERYSYANFLGASDAQAGLKMETQCMRERLATAENIGNEQVKLNEIRTMSYQLNRRYLSLLKQKAAPLFKRLEKMAEGIGNAETRGYALEAVATGLAKANLQWRALLVFNKGLAAAEKVGDFEARGHLFLVIAASLAAYKFKANAIPAFEKAIAAVQGIQDVRQRDYALANIAFNLKEAGIKENGFHLYEKLVAELNKVPVDHREFLWVYSDAIAEAGLSGRIPIPDR